MVLIIPSRIWEYIIAGLAIILAPGPSVLFTIARAIAWGRLTAVLTCLGNTFGMFTVSVVVAFGLGPIFQHNHTIYITMQWMGALYLVYLGIMAIREARTHAAQMTTLKGSKPTYWKTIREGYMVGVLNPKGIIFFAAILPQFTDSSKGHLTAQLLLLGFIFVFLGFFCDSGWGILAGSFRNWLASNDRRLVQLRIVGGVVMMGLGVITFVNSLLQK